LHPEIYLCFEIVEFIVEWGALKFWQHFIGTFEKAFHQNIEPKREIKILYLQKIKIYRNS
jgi:hypothetical protein